MPARPKLTRGKLERLEADLRRRRHVLIELMAYDFKRLAGIYGLHVETIRRMDWALHGGTVGDRNVWLLIRKLKNRCVDPPTLDAAPAVVPSSGTT